MIHNRINQRNSDVTKFKEIIDWSLKMSMMFDDSQKTMPTGIIKERLLQCKIRYKSLLGKDTGELSKLQRQVKLTNFQLLLKGKS